MYRRVAVRTCFALQNIILIPPLRTQSFHLLSPGIITPKNISVQNINKNYTHIPVKVKAINLIYFTQLTANIFTSSPLPSSRKSLKSDDNCK